MTRFLSIVAIAVMMTLPGITGIAFAEKHSGQKEMSRLENEVRHEIVMLPFYSVFDHFAFKVNSGEVTLMGYVSRPTLKTSAERVVKGIEGVTSVINEIEVLPVSSNDDRIRRDAYRAIYYQPVLSRYAIQSVPPIHIIVRNGDVTLFGVVGSEQDKTIANLQTNGVSGVFSVTNNLTVERN
ncbi:MAG: BON domain-containing protein [Acidobacteria bacterium]|nr:BON domain-containing protein [Acidobacteriota bacterium]